jgi:hypothetical protein
MSGGRTAGHGRHRRIADVVDGVLTGTSLDQSVQQLPGCQRIGVRAFSAHSRASDHAHGVLWYAALGIGGQDSLSPRLSSTLHSVDARSGDLNFRVTSTLTQSNEIGLPQPFPWELQATRQTWFETNVKIVVKTTSTFYHNSNETRTLVRKSSSKSMGAGERGSNPRPQLWERNDNRLLRSVGLHSDLCLTENCPTVCAVVHIGSW